MKNNQLSLLDQWMQNEDFRKAFEVEEKILDIEYQLDEIMRNQNVSQKELADRLGIDKSVVSKGFSGALRKAGVKKLQAIANALDCEFIPLFVPKKKKPA